MEKFRWLLILVLFAGGLCFLAFSLYKKHEATKQANFQSNGSYYNLEQPDSIALDSLQYTDKYLYLLHKGVSFSRNNQPDSAAVIFKQMIDLKPQAAFAYCELGKAFIASKNYDSSLFYLNRALMIKPNYTQARHFKNIAEHRKNGDEDYD